jgi:DNA polymerase-3 subunit epsilon
MERPAVDAGVGAVMPMMAVVSTEDGTERGRDDQERRVSPPPWFAGPLVGFDLETTGIDPATARIVTASLVFLPAGGPATARRTWLVDPWRPHPR